MFSQKSKLDKNLEFLIKNKSYKNYRVLVHCKTMQENIENKIKGYKCEIIRSIPYANCICSDLSQNIIERLCEMPQVDYIALDNNAFLCGSSVNSANGVSFQEKYKLTGKGICIGVIDSGVYPHPDLLQPTNRIKKFVDLINSYKYPYDDNGHGTFISGLICSSGYISKHMYRGIAEGSSVYAIKAFNSTSKGFISDILYSLQLLLKESTEYNIKIICLPFELPYNDTFILSLFSTFFKKAFDNGIIVVVPSGHNGNKEGSIQGIATLNHCITVGGINTINSVKPYIYSSAGPFGKLEKPDLCAACVDICSLNSNTSYISERNGNRVYTQSLDVPYVSYTGTSCACAYISGVCALLLENNPELSFKDIISLLKISCKLSDMSKWIQGAGILDLNKLLP